ncbi:MAG: hypothetical protein CMI52_03275 [Parcubacteria group bacterium]|nr:hypothetical protein [Parcubacteria group bacterium]
MAKKDKFSATWVSHSSISDYLKCPRAYYLKNVYKDTRTGHKVKVMSPALALGGAVHEVLESLSVLPKTDRFRDSLIEKFDVVWKKFEGEKGGFASSEQESNYKKRGQEMLRRVMQNPGPLSRLAVKIQMDLPYFWLSDEDNIILCGLIDWLEYDAESKSVHIIDFKTGKNEESKESLQLPIYRLLVENCQEWPVVGASYWYVAHHDEPIEQVLPPSEESREKVLKVARDIKLARQIKAFKCKSDGCFACKDLELIVSGQGRLVGVDDYGADIYVLEKKEEEKKQSVIL